MKREGEGGFMMMDEIGKSRRIIILESLICVLVVERETILWQLKYY